MMREEEKVLQVQNVFSFRSYSLMFEHHCVKCQLNLTSDFKSWALTHLICDITKGLRAFFSIFSCDEETQSFPLF